MFWCFLDFSIQHIWKKHVYEWTKIRTCLYAHNKNKDNSECLNVCKIVLTYLWIVDKHTHQNEQAPLILNIGMTK